MRGHLAACGSILCVVVAAACGGDKKPACPVGGNDTVALYQRGTDLIGAEPMDAAKVRAGVACMDRILALDAKSWIAHSSKGWAFMELGEHGPAVEALRAAKALQPENADVARDLAMALLLAGDKDQAKQEASRALALSPAQQSMQHVARVVDEVAAGTRPPPKALADVMP